MVDDSSILEATIKSCEKEFGKGSIMYMSNSKAMEIDKKDIIPSSSLGLNRALGIGGLARGRICELFGAESSGKTSISLDFIAQCQKSGGRALFLDSEHALSKDWCATLGVDLDKCLISQPDDGEQTLTMAHKFISSNTVDIMVIDSVAALVTKAEIEGEVSDSNVAGQARLMSKFLRMLNPAIAKSKCCVIFINQTRMKIGMSYGDPTVTSGGNALKFYASTRIQLAKSNKIEDNGSVIGNLIRVKIVKNKLASPFTVCEIPLFYGKGFSKIEELIDELIDFGLIVKDKAMYSIDGQKGVRGRKAVKTYLEQNPELVEKYTDLILSNKPTESKEETDDSGIE